MLHTGVDVIEISRIERAMHRHGERFCNRFFTPRELEQCGRRPASLAARYAAKEAVAKALGCGIGDVSWTDIEVVRDQGCRPEVVLHGPAGKLAAVLGLHAWSISLSHTHEHAVAFVVALGPSGEGLR